VFCDLFGLMKLSETSQAFCSVKHLFGCSSLQSMNDKKKIMRNCGDLSYWYSFLEA